MELKYVEKKLGDWSQLFKPFIESEKFDSIYKKLKEDSRDSNKIFPLSENTFKAFELCSPENLKVILIGQDVYPGEYYQNKLPHATGLAFDNSNSPDEKLQPSLNSFWEGIASEYSHSMESYKTHDLHFLAEQGVLLLNRSLTVIKNKIGVHQTLWDEFFKYFLEEVLTQFPNVPVVLLGKDAEVLKKHLFEMTHPIFILSHPSAAARTGSTWETKKTFIKLNKYLIEYNKEPIVWNYKPIAEDDENPF